MVNHCAAFGCSNSGHKLSSREKNISFHCFPLNDKIRLKKWLINMRRKDFYPNSYTSICSEHFNEEDFMYNAFTNMRFLKKDAVPTKFNFRSLSESGVKMEGKTKSLAYSGKHIKAFIGKAEKKCNKCGFVTFCLHVLYNHKIKCCGQLLGNPIFCSYCRRKFNFVTVYNSHKATCVKKLTKQKLLRTKLRRKHLRYKEKKVEQRASFKYSFSCPICRTTFKSKLEFVNHLKKQNCTSQQKSKKASFSARKSLGNHKSSNIHEDNFSSSSKHENHSIKVHDAEQLRCVWCKSSYPSRKLLFLHLERNDECARAYYQANALNRHKKSSLTARKTISVVAKKSFSHRKYKTNNFYDKNNFIKGSARKSLPSSRKKSKAHEKYSDSNSTNFLNDCPVCYKEFPDMFTFYQHQKKRNHWGKATKSVNITCKCPFCGKEFLHVKSRNAHVRNHTNKSEGEIKAFLKSTTCSVCSQIFLSAVAKHQHMRIKHPTYLTAKFSRSGSEVFSPNDSDYASKHKMSSVPSSVKKKLKQQPNTCPVCSKAFTHTVLRNKHFNEVHLKIFECQFCNTKFKSTSSLSNHIQLCHGKDFECRECKVEFKNELQLLQHVLKAHPNQDPKLFLPAKPLKNISLKEKSQDQTYETTAKNTEKVDFNNEVLRRNSKYYCDVCDIGYLKLCGLQSHRQSRLHKDTLEKNLDAFQKSLSDLPPSPPPARSPRIVKQPEILTCSECSEEFTNIKDFVPHRLSHFSVQSKYLKISELNPYMCEVCSEVLDSHSKVQLHLFWHLQIESTSNNSTNMGPSKRDTIVPDRLSGQHVAKKSFSKQSSESLQEVVIGGVTKPLFTCETCNIGFTTEPHYKMHVRKLCKKIRPTNVFSKTTSAIDSKKLKSSSKTDIVHCKNCNFLFCSQTKVEQHKVFCIKYDFDSDSEENIINSDVIKCMLNLEIAVAGCVTCGALFDNFPSIAAHISIHQAESDNSITDDIEDVLHCALCNSLFPLHAFKAHKDFCKIPVNIGDKVTNSKHINVLKSALELKCALAGCISCGEPFDDLETFSKHLTLHQTNQIQNESFSKDVYNGDDTSANNMESGDFVVNSSTEFLISDLENCLESDNQEKLSSYKSLDFGDSTSDSFTKDVNHDPSDDIEDLRKNFSQLLCLLISDPELMQTLGYGEHVVDVVLINVLTQMGQEACTDSKTSDIERLRTNIQILLNLCLKEQIMQAIGNDKTTDEIVIEALNIFASDDNMPSADDLSAGQS